MDKKRVALLMGGWSSERDVSLSGGKPIGEALRELGHEVAAIDVQRDLSQLIAELNAFQPDVAFNILHGRWGEDGCIQGVLDILKIPYTHSNLLASSIAMDKPIAKKIVAAAGIRVAEGHVLTRNQIMKDGFPFEAPFVIKPPNEGSSVGVRIVHKGQNFDVLNEGWVYGEQVLVERYVPGRELTVGLMGPKALTVTEIVPKVTFYDYTAKYTDGFAVHVCPAKVPEEVMAECLRIAETCYTAIGCNGVARIDVRYDDSLPGTQGLFFLELNTQPGFTPLSLVPEQAAALGISFKDLCQWIVDHPVKPV
jgi:D-alanine-D-alanine ligase